MKNFVQTNSFCCHDCRSGPKEERDQSDFSQDKATDAKLYPTGKKAEQKSGVEGEVADLDHESGPVQLTTVLYWFIDNSLQQDTSVSDLDE